MLKNNLPKKQLSPSTDHPVKNWSAFAFGTRLIFTGMVAFGVFSVNPALFKFPGNGSPVSGNNITTPQPVLADKTANTPNPSLLSIPSLNISAPFEPLGLNSDHAIAVPKNNMGVGWFVYGAKPGEVGASVVVGHLDSVWGRAVFADLNKIKPGDKIFITRSDGSIVTYRVDSLSQFSQNNFPTQAVYSAIPYAGLRLITCSGTWNKKAGHYNENLVVFATEI